LYTQLFASSCKTSTLTHLSLSLNRYPSLGQFSDVVGRTLHSLVSAFATLHSVQYLSIGSTPHPDEETLSDPVALLQTISDGYKNELKGLLLHVGEFGDEVVAAKSSGTFVRRPFPPLSSALPLRLPRSSNATNLLLP
jgi:hypothetical protein